ncbi:multidrug effflux MFS transporter [Paenibacillus sp. CGMCC 1.16610]|uniref:Bcr/CflA family efflux transporter n=2 Tax=Paenibacillus TaxID=44249 RepID=A0ABU6D7X6_9BACL|nr:MULTISPECIES: multidrug effflux MFS transporter [Paenibacillus]MBA2942596.1 multidrug effflux MFS transporter [Paenibacillus sp. CGMCC 1.16610]MCY9661757.1 multidrug effflux MFS transporter [Paenibacillus anseongense]MEB4793842.1 multidrug effflux MFS transporter [Paenibacillus chondroitinus]MVQ35410.1 Bcr/CflA family efflux MFS transporter [Paenibacillus anseongense]
MTSKNNQHAFRLALLLGLFSTLGPFTIDMYLPAFPEIVKQFGTTASLVQLSLTACLLGLGIGQLVMGSLSDVYGRRNPLLISMAFYVVASLACAFSPNIGVLIAFRFVQGFSASAGIVISRAIARDLYSGHELTKFFSLLLLVGNLGPLVAPVTGSGILSFTTWIGVFIALAILGLYLLTMTKWKLQETLPSDRRRPSNFMEQLKNYGSLLRDRQFVGYMLAQGIMIAGVFAYVSGTPFIYQNIYGASPTVFALLFGSNGISLIIGSQVVGRMSHRVSEQAFLLFGLWVAFFASLTVLVVAIVHGPLFALVIPLFFFVAAIGITSTAAFPLAMESQSQNAGSAAALLGVIPFLLGAVVSPLVGIAGENTAVPLGVIILLTSAAAMFAYFILVRRGSRGVAQR